MPKCEDVKMFSEQLFLGTPLGGCFCTSTEILYLDHLDYAYALIDDFLQPYLQRRKLSDDFLLPCPCLKCTRDNVCSCRKFSLPCCEFYKMSNGRYL